ncbi:MAG: serine/threonine-protein kinase, partial [Thermoguttaceae bacterium]
MDNDSAHDPTLSLSLQRRIDCVCLAFEDAWKSGQQPTTEQFLADAAPADRPALLRELLRIDREYRSGRPPTWEDHLPCLPADAETLTEALPDGSVTLPDIICDPHVADGKAATAQPRPAGDAPTQTFVPRDVGQEDARSAPPQQAELPEIPDHDVIEVLGRGGMGMVLRARHRVLDRIVAVKMPLAEHWLDEEDWERFLREARAAAGLQHPNICTIYEVGRSGGRPYISMALVEGRTLAQWAKDHKPNGREAAEILLGLARAVDHAHHRGILHRDIKPSNVMVEGASGQPMLMDFGLAKQLAFTESDLTHSGQVLGTPAYMAPEQAAGHVHQVGTHSDIYALGAVLYYLLCGRPPFLGSSGEVIRQVQTDEPPPPRRFAPRIHRDLETICLHAMAHDPARRYGSAGDLADDLARFLAGEAILARCEGPITRLWRTVARRPAISAIAGAAFLIMIIGSYLVVQSRADRQTATLVTSLEADFDAGDWSAERLAAVDAKIVELDRRAPEQATQARARLVQRLAAGLQEQLKRPTLAAAQLAQIEALLALLTERDAEKAETIRVALQRRLQNWETVFHLSAPFTDLPAAFDPATVAVGKDALSRKDAPAGKQGTGSVLATRVASAGRVLLEAVFDASWEKADQLGLVLNAAIIGPDAGGRPDSIVHDNREYRFQLRTMPPEKAAGQPKPSRAASFAENRKGQGVIELQILRGPVALRTQYLAAADVPPGLLRLKASKIGDHLQLEIGSLQPVDFFDPFAPRTGEPGVFAIDWPHGVGLCEVRGLRQSLPETPSPLERGDSLFDAGKYAEALVEYQDQSRTFDSPEVGQQIRYKAGLCLLVLLREDEARSIFDGLAGERGEQWP